MGSSSPPLTPLDLTPPEERQERRVRWFWISAVAGLLALAVIGTTTGGRIQARIKRWHSTRLAQQALTFLERGDDAAAGPKIRDALHFDSQNEEAWLAAARFLSSAEHPSEALEWWRKIAATGTLESTDRRAYAAAALRGGAVDEAEQQVAEVLRDARAPEPADLLLRAQVAARRQDGIRALDDAERVLSDRRTLANQRMAAALLIYSFSAPASAAYGTAWGEFEKLASDSTNPMSLDALAFLALQPGRRVGNTSLDAPVQLTLARLSSGTGLQIGAADMARRGLSPAQLATALETHPNARPYHHLLALECRAREEPERTTQLLREAVEKFANGDDEAVTELGSWLFRSREFEMLLAAIPVDRASKQQNHFLQHLDALSALGRFGEVVQLVTSERFPLDPVLQHIYLAIARTELDESAAAANEWQRALENADNVSKLIAVGTHAERANVPHVAEAAYGNAAEKEPRNRPAAAGRLRAILLQGDTARAFAVASEICQRWPEDNAARNDAQYLGLLLHHPSVDPSAAEGRALSVVLENPAHWPPRATLALARMQQGRFAAALQAFDGIKASGSEPPGALAVRVAALEANGWIDGAKNDARNLAAAHLLPEERALIARLAAD